MPFFHGIQDSRLGDRPKVGAGYFRRRFHSCEADLIGSDKEGLIRVMCFVLMQAAKPGPLSIRVDDLGWRPESLEADARRADGVRVFFFRLKQRRLTPSNRRLHT